ncbi:Hypothetical protein NTJ_08769 [Nesidiocoris tenuis]|uniref:Uncharacterized protein n=1 Tax=Nesidiocoris tenuis TaxID=355587 RepID=A0ABN7AUW3_9HEMI|nr:Hypothetical protein NTJ_08769 [Nesidiocoris tenuis]
MTFYASCIPRSDWPTTSPYDPNHLGGLCSCEGDDVDKSCIPIRSGPQAGKYPFPSDTSRSPIVLKT